MAMVELPRDALEMVWEDGEFVMSRSVCDADLPPLLVVTPVMAQPMPETLKRLEHAYALRDELEPTWAARPIELVHHNGQPALVIEDHGGELLARILGEPWDLRPFLRV